MGRKPGVHANRVALLSQTICGCTFSRSTPQSFIVCITTVRWHDFNSTSRHRERESRLRDVPRVRDRPRAKAFHLTLASGVVGLRSVAFGKRFFGEMIKNPKEFFTVTFPGRSENVQHCVVNGVFIGQVHRPSAERRSCKARSSSAS